MRILILIATLCLALPAQGQSVEQWLRRWKTEQEEASITMARLRLTEDTVFDLDGAFGTMQMEIITRVSVDHLGGTAERTPEEIRVHGRVVTPASQNRRRRYESPVRRDLQREADRLIFPYGLLAEVRPIGEPELEIERVEGRDQVKIATASRTPEGSLERLTWIFDKASGHLVQTRAIITGPDRGTLLTDTYYKRREGMDIAVRRELNGSFASRRRTRTFTVLLKASGEFVLNGIDSL